MVAASAEHAERWNTPDRWHLRADEAWWKAKAVGHCQELLAHCEAFRQELPAARGLPPPR
eukprot:4695515-Alexandrium_andersonii.AAC.1